MATKAKTLGLALSPTMTGIAAGMDLAGLEYSIAFALRLAQTASFGAFARRTQQAGLKPGHYAILHLVGANSGIAPTALSKASGRDKSTITPIVAELSKLELLTSEGCEKDRRSRRLYLTPEGHRTLKMLETHAAGHDAMLDELIGAENKPLLLEWLGKIANAVEADLPPRKQG